MERLIQAEENARRQMAENVRITAENIRKEAKRAEQLKIQQEAFYQAMKDENKQIAKELMFTGMKLRSPNGKTLERFGNLTFFFSNKTERVRMSQWLKKLSEMQSSNRKELFSSNQYLNYLRVTLQGDYQVLTKPFNTSPPDVLVSLGECLANKVADAIPYVPRAGEMNDNFS